MALTTGEVLYDEGKWHSLQEKSYMMRGNGTHVIRFGDMSCIECRQKPLTVKWCSKCLNGEA